MVDSALDDFQKSLRVRAESETRRPIHKDDLWKYLSGFLAASDVHEASGVRRSLLEIWRGRRDEWELVLKERSDKIQSSIKKLPDLRDVPKIQTRKCENILSSIAEYKSEATRVELLRAFLKIVGRLGETVELPVFQLAIAEIGRASEGARVSLADSIVESISRHGLVRHIRRIWNDHPSMETVVALMLRRNAARRRIGRC